MNSRNLRSIKLSLLMLGVAAWAPPVTAALVISGVSNTLTSSSGFGGIFGSANKGLASNSVIVGDNNQVSYSAAAPFPAEAWRMLVVGDGNKTTAGANTIVGGFSNTVQASTSLIIGESNTVRGSSIGTLAYDSSAIGAGNLVTTTYGWAIGSNNTVTGNSAVAIGVANQATGLRSVAFGSNNQSLAVESAAIGSYNIIDPGAQYSYALGGGLRVSQGGSVALGSWNAPMVAGDVLVVGAGTQAAPSTALRVTSDGSVILGRAQGDIAMGSYQ